MKLARSLNLAVAAIVVVLDQITKAVVRATLELHESMPVVPGLLDFTHVRNTGAAFGFLNAAEIPHKQVVMTVIAVIALLAIAVYSARLTDEERLARFGLALIIGGAAGNLADRVRHGYVTDFVDAYWGDWHFWAFNLADSAITIGAAVLILDLLGTGRHVSKAA